MSLWEVWDNVANTTPEKKGLALHAAMERLGDEKMPSRARSEVMRRIKAGGVDFTAKNEQGDTVLTAAIKRGEVYWVTAMLEEKADPHAKDKFNWTPMMTALRAGNETIADLLATKGACTYRDDIADTFSMEEPGIAKAAIAYMRADVLDLQDKETGDTLLILAMKLRRTDAVKELLEKGADVDVQNFAGETVTDIVNAQPGMEEWPDFLYSYRHREKACATAAAEKAVATEHEAAVDDHRRLRDIARNRPAFKPKRAR